MEVSTTGDKYILMLSDKHSSYSWFYRSETTSGATVAHALVDLYVAFAALLQIMSDALFHF